MSTARNRPAANGVTVLETEGPPASAVSLGAVVGRLEVWGYGR
jgi:hypothetical protein